MAKKARRNEKKEEGKEMKEEHRQLFHFFFGFAIVIGSLLLGRDWAIGFLLTALAAGLLLIHITMRGFRHESIQKALEQFERKVEMPGKGALMFVIGALFILTYSHDFHFALAVLAIVSAGDAFSTLVGIRGKHPLFWNKNKTWEGTIAFVLAAAIASLPFLSFHAAIAYCVLAAAIETLPAPVDDNWSIPVGAFAASVITGTPK